MLKPIRRFRSRTNPLIPKHRPWRQRQISLRLLRVPAVADNLVSPWTCTTHELRARIAIREMAIQSPDLPTQQTTHPPEDSVREDEMFAPGYKPQKIQESGEASETPDAEQSAPPLTAQTVDSLPPKIEQRKTAKPPTDQPRLSSAHADPDDMPDGPVNAMGVPTFQPAVAPEPEPDEVPIEAVEQEPNALEHALAALPAPFQVEDPARMTYAQTRQHNKILLPDAQGGTRQIDQRIVTVEYKGERVELVARTPEEQVRYRRRITIISMIIGLIFIAIAFAILLT